MSDIATTSLCAETAGRSPAVLSSDEDGVLTAGVSGGSPGRRGLALAAGFWIVIVALLGARVALFDEIAAARVAHFVSTQVASLSSILLR